MIEVIPAILATSDYEYSQKIEKIEESGAFTDGWIQVDFMDNLFVQNQTVDRDVLNKYPTNLHVEAHLMVVDPEEWIVELSNSGVERIITHIETIEDDSVLKKIKEEKIEVGLAINPETEVAKLTPYLHTIDVVLVMSVKPGFGGQEFIPETIEKIAEISHLRSKENLEFKVEVDGGVSEEWVAKLADAGCDRLIIGSHLVEGNINENLEKIKEKYKNTQST
jgi:ribulose-phosphate 3-epimerase